MRETGGFNHLYATINGLRYHYVREGGGPPLFLIHGWPGFYYDWHLNIKPLAQRFDVIAPDMRGYGHSDKPDLTLRTVRQCGHWVQRERPELVNQAIAEFIAP